MYGLASLLGVFSPIPHGVACGSLLAEATQLNIQAMQQRDPANPSLAKYKTIAKCFDPRDKHPDGYTSLIAMLRN